MSRRKLILLGFLVIAICAALVAAFLPSEAGVDGGAPASTVTATAGNSSIPTVIASTTVNENESVAVSTDGITPAVTPTVSIPFYEPTWSGPAPILMKDNQGQTFGPGQVAFAYAEGLGKDQPVLITLAHAEQGQLAQAETTSDFAGHASVQHLVRPAADAQGARPAGTLTFTLGAGDVSQTLAFVIDYQKVVEKPAPAVGISATTVQPGTAMVFWCSGFEEGATITLSLTVNGQAAANDADLFQLNPAGSDGVVIGMLTVFEKDPKGTWTIQSGLESCRVSFKVE